MNFRNSTVLLLIWTLLFPPMPFYGQGLSVGVKAEIMAGLDPATRALIEQYPHVVQEAIISTLQQAQPIIDKSIHDYIATAGQMINEQLDNAQCTATGISQNVADVWLNKILPNHSPKPLTNYDKDVADTLHTFTPTTAPTSLALTYGDLAYRAMLTWCAVRTAGVADVVHSYQNNFRNLHFTWETLVNRCNDAADCFNKVHVETQTLIDKSDPRDVKLVSAKESIARISVPAAPDQSLFSRVSDYFRPPPPFDIAPYSDAIVQMFKIQQGLALAKMDRHNKAAALVAAAEPLIQQVQDNIDAGIVRLKPIHLLTQNILQADQIAKAQPFAQAADALFKQAKDNLTKAEDLDAANEDTQVKALWANLSAKRASIDAIKNQQPYNVRNGTPATGTTDVQTFGPRP